MNADEVFAALMKANAADAEILDDEHPGYMVAHLIQAALPRLGAAATAAVAIEKASLSSRPDQGQSE